MPVITLDQLLPLPGGGRVTAIKIDVENYEYEVLLGGRQLLQQHQPLVYAELWEDDKKKKCMELMEGLGYTVKIYRNGRLTDYKGEDVLNYFFLPSGYGIYDD